MWTQQEGGQPLAKKRPLAEASPTSILIMNFRAPTGHGCGQLLTALCGCPLQQKQVNLQWRGQSQFEQLEELRRCLATDKVRAKGPSKVWGEGQKLLETAE